MTIRTKTVIQITNGYSVPALLIISLYQLISIELFLTEIILHLMLILGGILQLCKVLSVTLHLQRRRHTYKTNGQTDGQMNIQGESYNHTPINFACRGIVIYFIITDFRLWR